MLSLGFPSCCFASPTLAILWLRVSGKRLRRTQKNALHLYFLMLSMLKRPISNVYLNIRSYLFQTIFFVSFRYYYFALDYIEIYIIEFFHESASREISKHVNNECKMKTQMKMSRKERKPTNYVNISQVILHFSDFIKITVKKESCLYGYSIILIVVSFIFIMSLDFYTGEFAVTYARNHQEKGDQEATSSDHIPWNNRGIYLTHEYFFEHNYGNNNLNVYNQWFTFNVLFYTFCTYILHILAYLNSI